MNKVVDLVVFVLVVVGGINWGLVGAFEFNVVKAVLGGFPVVENVVYVLVGLAALVLVFNRFVKKV